MCFFYITGLVLFDRKKRSTAFGLAIHTSIRLSSQMENNSIFVILTVPHATCTTTSHINHSCDFAALSAANELSKALENVGIESLVLAGDINRGITDLNRMVSRYTTDFREAVRAEVRRRSSKREIFVLDVHSYPQNSKWGLYPIVFLYAGGRVPKWADSMGMAIISELQKPITILDNLGQINDIQDEMHSLGVKAILLEFNESNPREVLLRIARSIAQSLRKLTTT